MPGQLKKEMVEMMNAMDAILTRRSSRRFKDKAVEKDKLLKVIEAGRYAPSGGNSQTTHFIVLTNKEVKAELAMQVQESFAAMEITPGMYRSMANSIKASKTGRYIYDHSAPVLIITANKKDYTNNLADCVCALENMMIAANALDLGSCYINQLKWLNEDPDVLLFLRKLGLKDDERVYASLALGYADSEDGLPNRKPQERSGNPVTFVD